MKQKTRQKPENDKTEQQLPLTDDVLECVQGGLSYPDLIQQQARRLQELLQK